MEPTATTLSVMLSKWWIGLVGFFWWKTKKTVEEYESLKDKVIELEMHSKECSSSLAHLRELLEIKLTNIEDDIKEIKTGINR